MKQTPAAARLLAKLEANGEAWIVPAQFRLARRLESQGLLEFTDERRPNMLRGSRERRVISASRDGGAL